MTTSAGKTWHPCTCGHKVNMHDLGDFPKNVGPCDSCPCQDYREDLPMVIYTGAMGWMRSDAPNEEQWQFASFCVEYYRDEDDLSHVNYRTAWNEYLERITQS